MAKAIIHMSKVCMIKQFVPTHRGIHNPFGNNTQTVAITLCILVWAVKEGRHATHIDCPAELWCATSC